MWERIKERSGKEVDELRNRPLCPSEAVYVWNLYTDILKGCESVNYLDIDAFQRLSGIELSPWEVATIIDLDKLRQCQKT